MAEPGLSASLREAGGDRVEPVAEPFRLPPAGWLVGEELHPGGDFAGEGDEGASDLVVGEAVQGQVREPGVFGEADAVLGSERARRWCRNSRSASWPWRVLVANAVIRCPSTSVIVNWAPGCGLSLQQMARIPAGQLDRSRSPVSSATHARSRTVPWAS